MLEFSENDGLFRQEVVEAQSRRLHGEVILQQSLPTRIITAVIVAVVIVAVLWAVIGRYARVETARGVLVPANGYSKIYALRPGVVSALMVRDGDQVRLGQKLAVVRIEMPNASGAMGSRRELRSIDSQAALAQSQLGLVGERSVEETSRLSGVIDGLRQQLATLKDQANFQEQIVRSMSASFEQVKPVVEKGYISKIDYERRRQALLSAQEDLSRLQQQMASVGADVARTEKERNQAILTGKSDRTSAQTALETLRQQRFRAEGEESYVIEAPVSGRVTAVQTGLGRTVEGSVPMMVIVPDGTPLRANLYVPSRAIGFVRKGQEIRLLYDAFPYERFGSYVAHVDTISRLAVAGQETDAPFKIDEPVYRVTATLDRQQINAYGEAVTLQAGMTLVGNLVLERQSFLDWVLDPVRAVSKRS